MRQKPRIAWFASFHPLSRSAYVSDCVLPLLASKFEIERFYGDGDIPYINSLDVQPFHHRLSYYIRHRASPFDAAFFQLEDSSFGLDALAAQYLTPGVALLHDCALDSLFSQSWARSGNEPKPDPKKPHEESVVFDRLKNINALGFLAPHLHGMSSIEKKSPHVGQTLFPATLFTEETTSKRRAHARRALGIRTESFVIATSSRSLLTERAQAIAGCMREFSCDREVVPLWIVQDDGSRALVRALHDRGELPHNAIVVDARSIVEIEDVIATSDALVALQFDTQHGLPPALYFALAAGIPSVVFDFGPTSELPSQSVLKIAPGRGESIALRAALQRIAESAELRRTLARNARAFAQCALAPALIAEDISQFLNSTLRASQESLSRRERQIESAKELALRSLSHRYIEGGFPAHVGAELRQLFAPL